MPQSEIKMKMSLDGSGVTKALNRAKASVSNFATGAIKNFAAIAGIAGFGMLAKRANDYVSQIQDLSRLSGTQVQDFQKLTFAAKQYGIGQEKVGDILKDVSDKVGDFLQTRGGPLADFFENIAPKIGVTADQFKNLSGSQSLQLYVDSLEKANLSQSEMTFFMEAIASDATMLLPLLSNNASELIRLGKSASKLGIILDDELIAKFKSSSNQIEISNMFITIWTAKILGFAIPAIGLLANAIGFLSTGLAMSIMSIRDFASFLGKSLGAVIEPAVVSIMGLVKAFEAASLAARGQFGAASDAGKSAINMQKEALEELLDIPSDIAKSFDELTSDLMFNAESVDDDFRKRAESIKNNWESAFGSIIEGSKGAAKSASKYLSDPNGMNTFAADKKGSEEKEKMGLDIERGEFEGRSEFLSRREKSRTGLLKLNEEARKVAAGGKTPDMAKIQELMSAAKGGKKDVASETLKTAQDSAELLKSINKGING